MIDETKIILDTKEYEMNYDEEIIIAGQSYYSAAPILGFTKKTEIF